MAYHLEEKAKIFIYYNKCTTLVGMLIMGKGVNAYVGTERKWEIFVSSPQFFCEL